MDWEIDKGHAEIGFSVRHLMVSKVRGVFKNFDAEIAIDEEQPERSRLKARIASTSLDTKNPDRDTHLRSPDFFDVERFPEIVFESSSVRRLSAQSFEIEGKLTIRDMTRPLTLKGDIEGPISDPWGNRRLGVSVSGEIDREDYGLTWNLALEAGGVLVGREVKISIDAELVEKAREGELAATVAKAV